MKSVRNVLLGALFITGNAVFAQAPLEKFYLKQVSPNNEHCVFVTREQLGDSQNDFKYTLIINYNKTNSDTVIFAHALTHDVSPPVFFWNKNSTKLIYEDGQGLLNEERNIKLFDIINRKVTFSTRGILNINEEAKTKYFDSENGILIYLEEVDKKVFDILALDIANQKIKKLKSVKVSDDPITSTPLISRSDKLKREVQVEYFEGTQHTLTLRY